MNYGELFILEVLKTKEFTTTTLSKEYKLNRSGLNKILLKLEQKSLITSYYKDNNHKNKYYKLK